MDVRYREFKLNREVRRSKNDPYGRVYKCGCMKSYLSYPALYIHIKNKHFGNQPEGTVVPATSKTKGRGRPPKLTHKDDSAGEEEELNLIRHGYYGGPSDPLSAFQDTKSALGFEVERLMGSSALLTDFELPLNSDLLTILAQYLLEVSRYVDIEVYLRIASCIDQLDLEPGLESLFSSFKSFEPRGVKFETLKHLFNWMYIKGYFHCAAVQG